MYFDLAAVKNMGDIKDVYWWKVTYIVLVQIHKYSIFYITHGQTPCPWWSVVYRQSAGSDLSSTRVQSPQPLPLCCQFPCTELQITQTVLHWGAWPSWLAQYCSVAAWHTPVLVCWAISFTWCSLWCYSSGNSCPHLLLCNWKRELPVLKVEFLTGYSNLVLASLLCD